MDDVNDENAPPTDKRFLRRAARFIWRLVLAGFDLYTVSLLIFLLLRLLTGERLWPVALLDNFAEWLLLFALPILVLMILTRHRVRAALSLVNAVGFLWLFGALFLPNPSPVAACGNPEPHCVELSVMTHNIAAGGAAPDWLLPAIEASGADIVALQEVNVVQAAALESSLLDDYPYRVLAPDGLAGIGLLSRYPIVEYDLFHLQTRAFPYLQATLDVEGHPLTVIVAHPIPPGFSRSLTVGYRANGQVDFPPLAERATAGGPTLLLGDFNATDQSQSYAILADAGLIDAHRVAGWGFSPTFPAAGRYIPSPTVMLPLPVPPLVRLDYVWTTADIHPVRVWRGDSAGSDHFSVQADLLWDTRP
jgi:vancomycin resistance protein VanJ